MLGSSSWSNASLKPPRSRPVSANPNRKVRPETVSSSQSFGLQEDERENDEEERENKFGTASERDHKVQHVDKQQSQHQRQHSPATSDAKFRMKTKFRPSSAPARRSKSVSSARYVRDVDETHKQSGSSISLGYLRTAAEKKKTRDREFARELFREEKEFKKKISIKIEQANKMMAAAHSSKSFTAAPDRDGTHMIKIVDPTSGDRIISVENFLREFEQLATVPLGQNVHQHILSTINNTPSKGAKAASTHHKMARTRVATRATQPSVRSSHQPQTSELDGTRARAAKIKTADRSQVQEELRSVLEGTIELTKVLQEQLHELKLKGWNVAPRS